jgi:hypothetical protein
MHPDRNAPRVQQLEYERRALIRVIPVALVISVVLLIVLPHGWVVVLAVCLASLLQSAGVAVSLRRERRRA